jgi:hypothetical protein
MMKIRRLFERGYAQFRYLSVPRRGCPVLVSKHISYLLNAITYPSIGSDQTTITIYLSPRMSESKI